MVNFSSTEELSFGEIIYVDSEGNPVKQDNLKKIILPAFRWFFYFTGNIANEK